MILDILTQAKTLELLLKLFENRNEEISFLERRAQKAPYGDFSPAARPLPRCAPEEQGIASARFEAFFRDIAADETIHAHTVLVLRGGRVIAEGSFAPYRPDVWHVSHSLCKSVTALAVGLLFDDGKIRLSDRAAALLGYKNPLPGRFPQGRITVKHLLTMSSGVAFNEAGGVTEKDWVKCFMRSAVKFEPGSTFQYNSMNSYILSAIVRSVTGAPMSELLRERLFGPMGIERFHWETCPQGIDKGGWGLYMLPEDIARLGQLCLDGGMWEGRRLLSRRWLGIMARKFFDVPDTMGDYGYGAHVWLGQRPGSYIFNGMLGQNCIVLPDLNMVLVTTAGNSDLFQKSRLVTLAERYFGDGFDPPDALPPDVTGAARLREYTASLGFRDGGAACPPQMRHLAGKRFALTQQYASILPLFQQVLQNSYSCGVSELSFECGEGAPTVTFLEGGRAYRFEIGFDKPAYAVLQFGEEVYSVAVCGEWRENEDGLPVLKLRIAYLELANERRIKLFVQPDGGLLTEWFETPGRDMMNEGIATVVSGSGKSRLKDLLLPGGDNDYLQYRVTRTLEPKIPARPVGAEERDGR